MIVKTSSLFLLALNLLSCSNNERVSKEQSKTEITRMGPFDVSYSEQLGDSINACKFKIDQLLDKYIQRLSVSKDSSVIEIVKLLSEYRRGYHEDVDRAGRLIYLASGRNKDNSRSQDMIEYYSITSEYEKIKAILTEICGNYLESGLIAADSINGVPACLYDF